MENIKIDINKLELEEQKIDESFDLLIEQSELYLDKVEVYVQLDDFLKTIDLDKIKDKELYDKINEFLEKVPTNIEGFSDTVPKDKLIFTSKVSDYFYYKTKRKSEESITNYPHARRVAEILDECKASSDTIVAGFLHDVIEDTEHSERLLRKLFTKEEIDLVLFHTEDKSKTWFERKSVTIQEVKDNENQYGIWLILADRIANMEEMVFVFNEVDWSLFNAPKESQLWYFLEILENARDIDNPFPKIKEYQDLMIRIFK